ncbi:caspase family protein [Neomegalonema perideroedes]|uniref:caspase family protein n=1 Tax=Neomegalonema perideroedes TaxID=217219 RepID=UPI0003A69DF5|nr:caspase family protein [Neomegalonema perideroedes]
MRFWRLAAVIVTSFSGMGAPVWAASHVALVIGNGAYATTPLKNPRRDAQRMAALLSGQGFDVEVLYDLDKPLLEAALGRFGLRSLNADTAVLYYSGHGIEVGGVNYLIPIGAQLQSEAMAPFQAVRLHDALGAMQGATRLQLALIDACRNNGFLPVKSGSKGMAREASPSGRLLISFAALAGQAAQDGSGDFSPYTQALAELLERDPQEDLRLALTTLKERVGQLAGARQEPSVEIGTGFSLGEKLSLTGRAVLATAPPPAPAPAQRFAPPPAPAAAPVRVAPAAPQPAPVAEETPAHLLPEPGSVAAGYLGRAQAGSAADMFNLGNDYVSGVNGAPQSYVEAARWYRRAADRGHVFSMYYLGEIYEHGRQGLAQDKVEAVRFYQQAADLGNVYAMLRLGTIYESGFGIPRDLEEARRWYEQVLDEGDLMERHWAREAIKRLDGK